MIVSPSSKSHRYCQRYWNALASAMGKADPIHDLAGICVADARFTTNDSGYRYRVLCKLLWPLNAQGPARWAVKPINEELELERSLFFAIPDAIVTGREWPWMSYFPSRVLVNRGNSQTCLEAVLRGIPTVVAANGLKTLFHEDGGAFVVDNSDDLAAVIEKALTGHLRRPIKYALTFLSPPKALRRLSPAAHQYGGTKWPADHACWTWLVKSMLFVGCHERAREAAQWFADEPWQALVCSALTAHSEGRSRAPMTGLMQRPRSAVVFPHYELAHLYG
jgi:hypothetical protein